MSDPERDLAYLQLATADLEKFLLSKEVYWTLDRSINLQGANPARLSMGLLLLVMRRLEGWTLTPTQSTRFTQLNHQIETIQDHWRSHWENKSAQEFPARLRLWVNYLSDYTQEPDNYAVDFPREVERRAMLDLLVKQLAAQGSFPSQLQAADHQLQSAFLPGDFVWEPELKTTFPKIPFWYLYGRLRE
jgi:hypothetical protein